MYLYGCENLKVVINKRYFVYTRVFLAVTRVLAAVFTGGRLFLGHINGRAYIRDVW
jgi:hypothetical protein